MKRQTLKTTAFWVTTILGPVSFVIGGTISLLQTEQAMAGIRVLGYPDYFVPMLGAAKLLGALAIAVPGFPRLKEWAYAGFTFDLIAATVSWLAVGGTTTDVVGPLVFLALVLASWALRPASRRLANAPTRTETSSASLDVLAQAGSF